MESVTEGCEARLESGVGNTSTLRRLFQSAVPGAALVLAVAMAGQSIAGPVFTGTGRFRFGVHHESDAIFSRDLNGDLLPDFVAVSNFGTVTVLLSSTRGAFLSSPRHYLLTPFGGGDEYSAAMGDFNGDGNEDLAVARWDGEILALLAGKGDGTFDSARMIPVTGLWRIMGSGDLDGDEYDDLVFGGSGGVITVLRGKSDATFHAGILSPLGKRSIRRAFLSDFNQDLRPDLVTFSDANDLMISLSNGDGAFAPGLVLQVGSDPDIALADDFNSDGRTDLITADVYSDVLILYPGNGDGTFDAGRSIVSRQIIHVANADFDGNGTIDLLVTHAGPIEMLLGNGDGTFQEPRLVAWHGPETSHPNIAGDFDRDGLMDFAWGSFTQGDEVINIVLGNGDGTFDRDALIPVGGRPLDLASGDFDGDGFDDLVTANENSNDVTLLRSHGDGGFTTSTIGGAFAVPTALVAGDLDGDGKLDLVVGQVSGHSVFLGNGDATFRAGETRAHEGAAWSLKLGDIDGNGSLDLARLVGHLDQVTIFRNHGDGTFDSGQTIPVADLPRSLVIGDFDGDGRDDIATANDGSDDMTLILQDATVFGRQRLWPHNYNGQCLIAGDFNEDGHQDLLTERGPTLYMNLGKGDGTFEHTVDCCDVGTFPQSGTGDDFNDDGHEDLVVKGAHDLAVFFGDGDGRFSNYLAFGAGPSPGRIVKGDFDGDGRTDMAAANIDHGVVAILMNRSNRSPRADAGGNRMTECSAPDGTPVILDGSASLDPDGDLLKFHWSSPVASIAAPTSKVTAGLFPLGLTQVTLLVDDGERQDDALIDVDIQDTVAPVMSAALDQAGGGSGAGGRDVRAARYIVRFSAIDSCDASVDVTAQLQLGACGSLPVMSGQIVTYRQSSRCSVSTRHDALKVQAPSLLLHVKATDTSGNAVSLDRAPSQDPHRPSRPHRVDLRPSRTGR